MSVNHVCPDCDEILVELEDIEGHVCPAIVSDLDATLDKLVEGQVLNLADLFKSAKNKGYITPSSHYEGAPAAAP